VNFKPLIEEAKSLVIPFLIIMLVVNVITQVWLKENILNSILAALGFAGFAPTLLVNISVAELQSINIFSLEGFQRVANSVGFLPTVLTLFGLPLLILFKIWRKEKIAFEEIFLFLFALVTFYMILHGVRFALIFSVATSLSAGYVIGNSYNYLKSYKNQFLIAILFGIILFYSLDLFSNAYVFGEQYSRGYGISENWKSALDWLKQYGNTTTLVATWWDPGHIIAGYTGLKVHADGAHCGPGVCIPYDHNIRIQDMGRIFSTSNEEEAYSILKKYTYLTKEQCDEVKKKYGNMIYDNILKEDPCSNITKIYFIASNDLIGKYYWLTYFGTGTGRQYVVLPLTGRDNQGNLVYGNGILTLAFKDNNIVPILNVPSQGIFNMVVRKMIFVYQGNQYSFDYSNTTNKIDGLVFSDGSTAIYMDPQTANSMFTRLYFFNGEGLKYFKLVYSNPEVKIFEVDF
jgi:dolichyl-diphosphooligosaccharide--protein glycosyltransferase